MVRRYITSILIIPFALIVFGFTSPSAKAQEPLTTKLIEERLNYLTGLKDFSTEKPLAQERLMKLVLELGQWGLYPKKYIQADARKAVPGCDEYITRADACRFVRELTGQDLRIWKIIGKDRMVKIAGDNLGWWRNTGNTMYDRPKVQIQTLRMKAASSPPDPLQKVTVGFTLSDTFANLSTNPPRVQVGSGTAILQRVDNQWRVTSWQIKRNKRWNYATGE